MYFRFRQHLSNFADGGGVDGGIQNSGSMTITNCTISGNSVGGSGLVYGVAAEFRIVAIFKLRAVPSRIILHQVETVHSAAGFVGA